MRAVLTLDIRGLASAVVLGVLLFLLGKGNGPLFLFSMLLFLVASAIVTTAKSSRKKAMNVHETERGWRNVWANGVVPLFIAALYFIISSYSGYSGPAIIVAYLAGVAAITADKFSSELGVLDRRAFMLLSGEKARPGVSGAVSLLGLAVGLVASIIIAGAFSFAYSFSVAIFLIVTGSGFVGDVVDSAFGYFEEKGIGNKFTTNVLCGASAALLALVLYGLLVGLI